MLVAELLSIIRLSVKKNQHTLLSLIGIGIINLFLCSNSYAQTRITINSYSKIDQVMIGGEQVRKMYDASLSTDNLDIIADSIFQYQEREQFHAFGNIQIDTEDGKHIWADSLVYFSDRDFSQLRGRVIIATDSTTLFGNKVDYLFSAEVAFFLDLIRLEDDDGILVAKEGEYFQRLDSASFRKEVQLSDSTQYAEGDSLFINRTTNAFRFLGNVFADDSVNNTLLTGDYMEGDSTGRRFLNGNAYLRRISEDSTATDTTHINADEILFFKEDSVSYTQGFRDVKIWSPRFSSVSDTVLYNDSTDVFELISTPRAWHKNIQLSGPYIRVELDDNNIKQLLSYPSPFAVQEDSLTTRLNQIKGDTLQAVFLDGSISRINVYPNSEILFYSTNENDEPDGAIEFNAKAITTMYFSPAGFDSVKSIESIDGAYIPESPAVAERRLDGFIWSPELRPLRPTSTPIRKYPVISKERPFSLPRRYIEYMNTLIRE